MDISIVVPLYNEDESLPHLAEWIDRVMNEHHFDYEVIMVDDGSKDRSWQVIEQLHAANPRYKGVKFRRNYGKSAALNVGFVRAEGDVVITVKLYRHLAPKTVDAILSYAEKGYYNDLNKIHDYVQKVTGVDSRIIRFPGGSSNTVSRKYNKTIMKTLKKSVTEKGYVFHDWNIDSSDASGINRDPDLLVSRVEAGLKKKKTVVDILMHDTGKSKMTTVEALPRIIEAVQAAGYTIEPLTIDSTPIQHNW